jgi:hypothetical protein
MVHDHVTFLTVSRKTQGRKMKKKLMLKRNNSPFMPNNPLEVLFGFRKAMLTHSSPQHSPSTLKASPQIDCGKTAFAVTTLLTAAVICGCGYQVS